VSLCVASAVAALGLATQSFTLSWVHSVERVEWQEQWQLAGHSLRLTQARVKGSGAGMEPPPDARWQDGWWVYAPALPLLPELWLAVSGATVGGWRLCDEAGHCHDLETLLAPAGSGVQRLRVSVAAECHAVPSQGRSGQ
jgi:hypothetical protein